MSFASAETPSTTDETTGTEMIDVDMSTEETPPTSSSASSSDEEPDSNSPFEINRRLLAQLHNSHQNPIQIAGIHIPPSSNLERAMVLYKPVLVRAQVEEEEEEKSVAQQIAERRKKRERERGLKTEGGMELDVGAEDGMDLDAEEEL